MNKPELEEKTWREGGKCYVAWTAKGSDGKRGVVVSAYSSWGCLKFREEARNAIALSISRGEIVIESKCNEKEAT